MVDPLSYFSIQPVLHNGRNKGHVMCYPVWDVAYKIKPLLLIGMITHVAAAGLISRYLNDP